jgi:phosphate transport system permease protein
LTDLLFRGASRSASLSVLLLAGLLVFFLVKGSWLAIHTIGFSFFIRNDWNPPKELFGAVPFVYGTVVTSALAMLIAVPISVGAATFLAEIAPHWLRRGASFLVELLAAIPSVVYGFWGIFFLVPLFQVVFAWLHISNPMGRGIFTASVILSIMIVPYIAAITFDVCRAVPQSQREGSLALGSTRWQTIWHIVLPYARPGIVGGCFLALGRA